MPKTYSITWAPLVTGCTHADVARDALRRLREGKSEDLVFLVREEMKGAHAKRIHLGLDGHAENVEVLLDKVLAAAKQHATETTSDMETRDLQEALQVCWNELTPTARKAVFDKICSYNIWLAHDM
jgi:hypothetical protein